MDIRREDAGGGRGLLPGEGVWRWSMREDGGIRRILWDGWFEEGGWMEKGWGCWPIRGESCGLFDFE